MISVDNKEFTNILESIRSKDSADMGVLIGYKFQDRSYIYSWCPSPTQDLKSKQISSLLTMPLSIEGAVYSDWVLQHCKELSRLLPSGVQVLGLYSFGEEDLKLDNPSLISSSVLKFFTDLTSELPLDDTLCLFHYNLLDNRYQSGILDLKRKVFQGQDIRPISLVKLEEIRGLYKLDLELGAEGTPQQLIQNLITEWHLLLENSVVLVDKQIAKEDVLLCNCKQSGTCHSVKVFSQIPGFCCNFDENRVRISGVIEVLVVAHPKATLKTVKDLVVKDLLYSLKNRIEIVSDSFEIDKNPLIGQVRNVKLQLPRRISFPLTAFTLTGYTDKEPDLFKSVVSAISTVKLVAMTVRETLPEFPDVVEEVEVKEKPSEMWLKIFWTTWAICLLLIIYLIKSMTS